MSHQKYYRKYRSKRLSKPSRLDYVRKFQVHWQKGHDRGKLNHRF